MTTQVVVTGLGMTTPVGGDVATTWQNLLAGVSGISVMPEGWPADQPCQIAGLMAVDPAEVLDRVEARKLDRSQQAALVAAREAWAQAGSPAVDPERLGAVISTGMGGLTSLMNSYDILLERGPSRISPHMVTQIMPNGPAAVVGLEVGARAGVHGQVSACASGAEAVSYAARMIQTGRADVVICGGTEAVIHPITMAGFAAMRALSTRNDDPTAASRPYDIDRDGFVMGEGAGRHGPRVRRVRRRPRRDGARRVRRGGPHVRRPPHRAARPRGPRRRARDHPRHRGRRPDRRRHRPHQRARDVDARRATSPSPSRSAAPSARPPTTSSSPAPSR